MSPVLRLLNRPVVALLLIAAVAGALRFADLGHPPERVFDEAYYSKDACLYAGHRAIGQWPRGCDIPTDPNEGAHYWVITRASDRGEASWVHPPLGKWAIAAGILGEGNTPFGWRVASAAAGTATVVLIALIAWLLFGSILWTYVSGLLLATETLNFVQSRTSMLDIFLAFWVVLGFLFLLLDRGWIERRTARALSPGPGAMAVDESLTAPASQSSPEIPSPIWRPWRFAAGAAFGAGCATKWSGAMALAAAALIAVAWEIGRRRRAGVPKPIWSTIQLELLGGVLAFVFVPVAVYLISYTRYFVDQSWHPGTFWSMQKDAWKFHSSLHYINSEGHNAHPYESKPWTWLAMLRPVSYYWHSSGMVDNHCRTCSEVLSMGHPLLFWGSIFAIPYVGWAWFKRRDWVAGFVVAVILLQYLPWFFVASRVQFLFYMTPVTPFLVLVAVYLLRDLSVFRPVGAASRPLFPIVVGYVAMYVALFVFFYPVLTGWTLSYNAWHYRMWMPSWI